MKAFVSEIVLFYYYLFKIFQSSLKTLLPPRRLPTEHFQFIGTVIQNVNRCFLPPGAPQKADRTFVVCVGHLSGISVLSWDSR